MAPGFYRSLRSTRVCGWTYRAGRYLGATPCALLEDAIDSWSLHEFVVWRT